MRLKDDSTTEMAGRVAGEIECITYFVPLLCRQLMQAGDIIVHTARSLFRPVR